VAPPLAFPATDDSRAILIGVSRYANLQPLPAVDDNLAGLRSALTDSAVWGLPDQHCTVLDRTALDRPDGPRMLVDALENAAAHATGTLVVYYAGHGLPDPDDQDELYLALPASDRHRPYVTAVPFGHIRRAVRRSPAARKVVIIDCCYSGIAHGRWLAAADLGPELAIGGTCVLTATGPTRKALSPPGEQYTAFTGGLIELLTRGIVGGPPLLDMETLYLNLCRTLRSRQRPEPDLSNRELGGRIVLAKNQAAHVGSESPATAPDPDPGDGGSPVVNLRRLVASHRLAAALTGLGLLALAAFAVFVATGTSSGVESTLDSFYSGARAPVGPAAILPLLGFGLWLAVPDRVRGRPWVPRTLGYAVLAALAGTLTLTAIALATGSRGGYVVGIYETVDVRGLQGSTGALLWLTVAAGSVVAIGGLWLCSTDSATDPTSVPTTRASAVRRLALWTLFGVLLGACAQSHLYDRTLYWRGQGSGLWTWHDREITAVFQLADIRGALQYQGQRFTLTAWLGFLLGLALTVTTWCLLTVGAQSVLGRYPRIRSAARYVVPMLIVVAGGVTALHAWRERAFWAQGFFTGYRPDHILAAVHAAWRLTVGLVRPRGFAIATAVVLTVLLVLCVARRAAARAEFLTQSSTGDGLPRRLGRRALALRFAVPLPGLIVLAVLGVNARATPPPSDPVPAHPAQIWAAVTPFESTTGLAFTSDGKRLVSGGYNGETGSVVIWDAETGKQLGAPMAEGAQVADIALSPDNKRLAVARSTTAGSAEIWDLDTRTRVARVWNNTTWGVQFNSDGSMLAMNVGDGVALWSAGAQDVVHLEGRYGNYANDVAFSPDNRYVVSGGGETVEVWDVRSQRESKPPLRGHTGCYVRNLAFAQVGNTLMLVSSCDDDTVRAWNFAERRQERELAPMHQGVRNMAVSPDGQRVAIWAPDGIQWRSLDGWWSDLYEFRTKAPTWTRLRYRPDGKALAVGEGAQLRLYRTPA
jgi:hypothetical protein